MFDTYVTEGRTEYVHTSSTVHEHRAPTDASVKLLNEMTEKAKQNIVAQLSTSNNTLQATATVWHDPYQMESHLGIKLVVNGKTHLLKVNLPGPQGGPQELVGQMHKALADKIASEVLQGMIPELLQSFRKF